METVSSRVSEKVSVKYNGEEKSFTMTAPYGTPTPAQEISIPIYDLVDVKEVCE